MVICIGRKKFESMHILHVPGGIEPLNIHAFPGTYCDKRTKPTSLAAFQTIFGIFHFSLAAVLIKLN